MISNKTYSKEAMTLSFAKQFLQKCFVRAWLIWVIAAIFYAYEFFIRVSPAVMVPDLMQAFNVDAALLGSLSAFYYYAYASMQIPVGILLDNYGIRQLLTGAAFMVTVGSIVFATTDQLWLADVGRVLMGIGSAFSFVGCLKLANNWFPARQLAIIIGLTNMLGVLGAVSAEAPLSMLVLHFGWRSTMIYVGLIGAVLALLLRLIVRDDPRAIGCPSDTTGTGDSPKNTHLLSGLLLIIKSPKTWLAAIYGGMIVAPIAAFTELWSVPFFKAVDHIPTTKAALISSMVFIGVAIGGPIIGWLSGLLKRRKPLMLIGNLGALICLSIIIYIPNLMLPVIIILLFLFGFCSSSMLLVFAINTEINPNWVSGVVIGFTNMVVMIGGTLFQPLVGWLLDLSGQDSLQHVLRFNVSAYQHALIILPVVQIVALVLLCFIKETRCQHECGAEG